MREVANMKPTALEAGCFDGRWQIFADDFLQNTEIRPLGEKGLLQLENWRELDVLRDILMQLPAAWRGNTVIFVPVNGFFRASGAVFENTSRSVLFGHCFTLNNLERGLC